MASVSLDAVVFNDSTDGSSFVCLVYAGSVSRTPTVVGATVRLAGGRVRSIAQAGIATQWQVTSQNCTPTDLAWLYAHTGVPVWVRDPWGSKTLGVFWSVAITPTMYNCNADVTLTLNEISV